MKSVIIKSIFTGIIIGMSATSFALPDISGNWRCHSQDPESKQMISISGEIKKTGDTYSLVNWKNDGANDSRSGTGLHNDKMKDSLAVMFWSNDNAEDVGFGLYQIKSKNQIVGTWTTKNGKVSMEETCQRIKA